MKTFFNWIQEDFRKPIRRWQALFLVIVGLLMGTVFTIGEYYWCGPIKKEDAVFAEAVFSDYDVQGNGRSRGVILHFSDDRQRDINACCTTETVLSELAEIKPGTAVQMLLHPRGHDIYELRVGEKVILAFDDAAVKMERSQFGFFVTGMVMYLFAILGAIKLVNREVY